MADFSLQIGPNYGRSVLNGPRGRWVDVHGPEVGSMRGCAPLSTILMEPDAFSGAETLTTPRVLVGSTTLAVPLGDAVSLEPRLVRPLPSPTKCVALTVPETSRGAVGITFPVLEKFMPVRLVVRTVPET